MDPGLKIAGVMDEESCCDNKKEGVIRGIYPLIVLKHSGVI